MSVTGRVEFNDLLVKGVHLANSRKKGCVHSRPVDMQAPAECIFEAIRL